MKNIKLVLGTLLMLSLSFSAMADGFTGTIKYKVSVEGREITPQEEAQMPSEQIHYFRGNMFRQDNISPMMSYFTIINQESLETTIMLDMMGKQYYLTIDGAKIKAKKDSLESDNKPTINLLEGSKTIAGYTCKKAEIINGKGENASKMIVFYTEDIKANNDDFEDIPGYPLKYTIEIPNQDLELVYEAYEVSTKKPKKKLFKVSSKYEEMPEEMKKQMGMEI